MKQQKIQKLLLIAILFNLILTGIKLFFGYVGHAQSLVSDGYNSFIDLIMSLMVLFMLKIATKQPDENHPYGHQKFEGVAYFSLGMIFLFTSGVILFQLIKNYWLYTHGNLYLTTPSNIALWVSLIALVIKFGLALFYHYLYKKTDHPTLKAESKNHKIDMISTSLAVLGIFLSKQGYIIFDYIAAALIALLILKLAISTIVEAVTYLVDQSPTQEVVDNIYSYIDNLNGVLHVDELKIRQHVTQLYVDVEIAVNKELSLQSAHEIAETVHKNIEKKFPKVIHCMVHVNPFEKNERKI